MGGNDLALHFVCTLREVRRLIEEHEEYWLANCGCRESGKGCARSRMDLCLTFRDIPASGSGKRKATRHEVEGILEEAERARLVPRPFRNQARTAIDGVCFCCDDCCHYFLNPAEPCDKGPSIESTRLAACTLCGACAEVCRFGARTIEGDGLAVAREKCYGCGLCVEVCPEKCIEMVARRG